MVTESSNGGTSTESAMAMGLKLGGGENCVSKSLDNIVGSLWQARQESSGSSIGNQSPANGDEEEVDMLSDAEASLRESSPEDTRGGNGLKVRLKDTRDLMKEDRPSPFLPHFPPGFEAALSRQSREFLSNPSAFLSCARTPPPSGGYPSYSPSNNNLHPAKESSSLLSPPSPGSRGGGDPGSGPGGDNSSSSQQNWSFEEQFKQLYEIDDNPKRKVFLDELFSLMQKRGTPINRLPIMAKQVLDLFELYNLVLARGGLVEVINKKLWQEVIKGLGLPSSITSAAFTLRTQYTKYLYPLECMQRNLSNPSELQMAIEGNKREGRRSSYGPYSDAVGHMAAAAAGLNPMSLHHHQRAVAAAAAAANNASFPSSLSPPSAGFPGNGGQDPMSALEMTRLALWKMYNNNHGHPPAAEECKRTPLGHKRLSEDREASSSPKRLHTTQEEAPIAEHPQEEDEEEEEDEEQLLETRPRREEPTLEEENPSATKPVTKHENGDKYDVDEEEEEIEVRESSPRKVTSLSGLPGANIKISSRGDGKSKDSSLVVSMEINGISYQGVLFAQHLSSSAQAVQRTSS